MDIYKEFGKRLAVIRQNQNFSQKQLSALLSIPQSTYAGYETGARKIPLDLIVELSKVLEVSPTFLILGEEAVNVDDYSVIENSIIKKYRQLDADGKERVDYVLNLEYKLAAERAENKEERLG